VFEAIFGDALEFKMDSADNESFLEESAPTCSKAADVNPIHQEVFRDLTFVKPNYNPAQYQAYRRGTSLVVTKCWELYRYQKIENSAASKFHGSRVDMGRSSSWNVAAFHKYIFLPVEKTIKGHGCLSFGTVMCCQVEVSATDRLLNQRSPTECGMSECAFKISKMRKPRPTRVVQRGEKSFPYPVLNHIQSVLCLLGERPTFTIA
jgi:hypothetical protein